MQVEVNGFRTKRLGFLFADQQSERKRYQIDGHRLEILDETGTQILEFVASSSELG